jgi:hypothetical protein
VLSTLRTGHELGNLVAINHLSVLKVRITAFFIWANAWLPLLTWQLRASRSLKLYLQALQCRLRSLAAKK